MARLTIRCIDKNVLDTLTKISDQLRGPLATLGGPLTRGPPRVAIGPSLKTSTSRRITGVLNNH